VFATAQGFGIDPVSRARHHDDEEGSGDGPLDKPTEKGKDEIARVQDKTRSRVK
jgi:hypothetical protein